MNKQVEKEPASGLDKPHFNLQAGWQAVAVSDLADIHIMYYVYKCISKTGRYPTETDCGSGSHEPATGRPGRVKFVRCDGVAMARFRNIILQSACNL